MLKPFNRKRIAAIFANGLLCLLCVFNANPLRAQERRAPERERGNEGTRRPPEWRKPQSTETREKTDERLKELGNENKLIPGQLSPANSKSFIEKLKSENPWLFPAGGSKTDSGVNENDAPRTEPEPVPVPKSLFDFSGRIKNIVNQGLGSGMSALAQENRKDEDRELLNQLIELSNPRNNILALQYTEHGDFLSISELENPRINNLAQAGYNISKEDPALNKSENVLWTVRILKDYPEISDQILKRGFRGAVARGSLVDIEAYLDSDEIEKKAMQPVLLDVLANAGYLGVFNSSTNPVKPLPGHNVPKAPVSALTDPGFFNPSLLDGILNDINKTINEIASAGAGNGDGSQSSAGGWGEAKEKKYQQKVKELSARSGVDVCKENPKICSPVETYRPETRVLCKWHCIKVQAGQVCGCSPENNIKIPSAQATGN